MRQQISFGTDGWRAIIGKDFNLQNVEIVAQAIADYLLPFTIHHSPTTKVVIGYDRRKLSPQAAGRIAQVLTANKIKVLLSDKDLPTQAVSYAVKNLKCTAGIMVTASHNPACFNGIKLKDSFGGSADKTVTDNIERFLFKQKPVKISLAQAKQKGLLKNIDLISAYLEFLRSYLNMSVLKKAGLKVLVDPMHGTANSYIEKILERTNCKVTTIHTRRDTNFGGVKPEPIPACLKEAAEIIKARGFDLGLVTDGDADRIAALDEKGRFVSPQEIMALLLLHLVRNRGLRGVVVQTISGSAFVDNIARKYKLKVCRTAIGFKNISAVMRKKDVLIGGEEAGGMGFKNYIPERDGILAGLLLLELAAVNKLSLTGLIKQMSEEFGSHVYLRRDIKCGASEKSKARLKLKRLARRKRFMDTSVTRVEDYDGIRLKLGCGGWILFRLSGTEPLLRIYAESGSLSRTKALINQGVKTIV